MGKQSGFGLRASGFVRTILDNLKWRRTFGRTKRLLKDRATSRCLIPLLMGNGVLTGGRK